MGGDPAELDAEDVALAGRMEPTEPTEASPPHRQAIDRYSTKVSSREGR